MVLIKNTTTIRIANWEIDNTVSLVRAFWA